MLVYFMILLKKQMIKYLVVKYFKEAIVLYNSTNYAKIYQRHSSSHLLPEKEQISLQLIWGTDNDKSHFSSCTSCIVPPCHTEILGAMILLLPSLAPRISVLILSQKKKKKSKKTPTQQHTKQTKKTSDTAEKHF